MSEEILYIDDGGLVYYVNYNEFVTCNEIPMPMLEGIKHLQQKVEQLENIRKEAIKWVNKHTTKFKDIYIPASESWYLLDILNKGSDKK